MTLAYSNSFESCSDSFLLNIEGGVSWAAIAAYTTGGLIAIGGAALAVAALPVAPIVASAAVGVAVFSGHSAVYGIAVTATLSAIGK